MKAFIFKISSLSPRKLSLLIGLCLWASVVWGQSPTIYPPSGTISVGQSVGFFLVISKECISDFGSRITPNLEFGVIGLYWILKTKIR